MGRMPEVSSHQRRFPGQPMQPRVVSSLPSRALFEVGTSCLRQGCPEDAQLYLRESLRL